MFPILEKIDIGITTKVRCTLMDKSGRHYHGVFEDSWIRISGGKLRGKAVFISEEKGRIEIEAYDILDILLPPAS